MPLTLDEAKNLTLEFCREYPVALDVDYKLRSTPKEIYETKYHEETHGRFSAGFTPVTAALHRAGGRGRCSIATSNIRDAADFRATLRHELLGHYGINTYRPSEKRLILNAIVRHKTELANAWAYVERVYPGQPLLVLAEEVYAVACEAIEPAKAIDPTRGAQVLRRLQFNSPLPLHPTDLAHLTEFAAAGMRDGSRTQQNFPQTSHEQFKRADIAPQGGRMAFFEVINGDDKTRYTDAKQAGAAFFAADSSMRPSVIHGMDGTPLSPGGSARVMANTEIHGTNENGQARYVKTLPNSHAVDAAFRAGYTDAQEKAVNRVNAFVNLQEQDALKAHPELKGIYAGLKNANAALKTKYPANPVLQEAAIQQLKAKIVQQLNTGALMETPARVRPAQQSPAPAERGKPSERDPQR